MLRNETKSLRLIVAALTLCSAMSLAAASAKPYSKSYTMADFAKVRKFDAHVHANVKSDEFSAIARKDGFELLSINVDYPDFPDLTTQAAVAQALRKADPTHFHFATTFSMKGFGTSGWTQATNVHLDAAFSNGAIAVKVWKNIGMVEKDSNGQLLFLDNPGFDGVMAHLERAHIPLIAHQAEPKNCWLPLDQMTTENDRSYFREHPEYHMFLHPDQPSYESLMAHRDAFVGRHPKLNFVGAHMGSLEWSVDVLAAFLDKFPNATVDLAARMTQVQYQSVREAAKVRAFFVKYQDRILYGSDLTQNPPSPNERAQNPPSTGESFTKEADDFWRSDWAYLATSSRQRIDAIQADVPGLALPRAVIDKIYWRNAQRVFLGKSKL
jgi:predicted TIM-barrel fold metal-dependent hydrolase